MVTVRMVIVALFKMFKLFTICKGGGKLWNLKHGRKLQGRLTSSWDETRCEIQVQLVSNSAFATLAKEGVE